MDFSLPTHTLPLQSLQLSEPCESILSFGKIACLSPTRLGKQVFRIIDLSNEILIKEISSVGRRAIALNDKYLVVANEQHSVLVWGVMPGEKAATLEIPTNGISVGNACLNGDALAFLFTRPTNPQLQLICLVNDVAQTKAKAEVISDEDADLNSGIAMDETHVMYSSCYGGAIVARERSDPASLGKYISFFPDLNARMSSISPEYDSHQIQSIIVDSELIIGSTSTAVMIWDKATGQQKKTWKIQEPHKLSLVEKTTLIGVANKTTRVWNLATGELLYTTTSSPLAVYNRTILLGDLCLV